MINIPDTLMTTDGYTPHKFINGFVKDWEDLVKKKATKHLENMVKDNILDYFFVTHHGKIVHYLTSI